MIEIIAALAFIFMYCLTLFGAWLIHPGLMFMFIGIHFIRYANRKL